MLDYLEFLNSFYQEIVIIIALGIGSFVIAYFRGIYNKQKENKIAIDKLCERAWRIERGFALFMKIAIDENKKNHKDSSFDEVEKLVNLILKDKYLED